MKKIVFLDRDGVINKDPEGWTEHSYVTKRDDFIFLPGVLDAIKLFNEAGYSVAVISNQAGVSKKFFTKEELDDVTEGFMSAVKAYGARIDGVYYCLHASADNCGCRKPKPGLFEKAEKALGVNAKGSFFIGDTERDIAAGRSYGLKTVLVLSGKSRLGDVKKWTEKPDYIRENLFDAANFIINNKEAK